jgi:hypothetical protein
VPLDTKTDRNLRKSQTEIANLEHDVRQQQEMLDALVASEASLRRKLERARSERAEYRLTAEKLQKQLRKATKFAQAPQAEDAREAIETVVRAAEGAETRHKKELRGAIVQMEWMQKRWEREASLRSDAAYAKKFLQLQLDVANAWYVSTVHPTDPNARTNVLCSNKAQLRDLESIRTGLLGSRKSLPAPTQSRTSTANAGRPTLRTVLLAARFVAKARIAARAWNKQEVVRKKLVGAAEETKKARRTKQLRVVAVEDA